MLPGNQAIVVDGTPAVIRFDVTCIVHRALTDLLPVSVSVLLQYNTINS